jgi:fluoride exporter
MLSDRLPVRRDARAPTIRPLLTIAILTGSRRLSTFSTFAMETLLLAEQGDAGRSALYVALSGALLAAFGGSFIARNL